MKDGVIEMARNWSIRLEAKRALAPNCFSFNPPGLICEEETGREYRHDQMRPPESAKVITYIDRIRNESEQEKVRSG